MNKVTLDAGRRIHLADPSQPFTICDEAGNVVGCYVPVTVGPPISREEIERRKQQKERAYTTAEVLAHLEKL